MNLMRSISLLAAVTGLLACATPYAGPSPDLKLRGESAQTELRQFEIQHDFFGQGWDFRMGPSGKRYTVESIQPLLREVSPRAAGSVQTAQSWRTAQTVILCAALGMLAGAVTSKTGSSGQHRWAAGAIAASGVSIGTGIISTSYLTSAAREFNEDLRAKMGEGSADVAFVTKATLAF